MSYDNIIALIQAGIAPAMGCTEPGAVALAAAYAREALEEEPVKLEIEVDGNVYKNGLAVGVPGTGETGLPIAAALGAVLGKPELKLQILTAVDSGALRAAKNLLVEGGVNVTLNSNRGLYIRVTLTSTTHRRACALIEGSHTNLTYLEVDGEIRFSATADTIAAARSLDEGDSPGLMDLIGQIEKIPASRLSFLEETVHMNKEAARRGLEKRLGMAVGATLEELVREKMLADDLVNYAKILTAAATDARMSGVDVPVMSVAGSGNHGITATLPLMAVAERMEIDEERLLQAIAISVTTTSFIKRYTGSLSALCGCAVAAAIGASVAIVWMLGGDKEQIEAALANMVANLTGMICDGGKVGCALKLSTAAGAAVETALLALKNVSVPASNGIIASSPELTIRNLGRVSSPGMVETDGVILNIMMGKKDTAS